MVYAGWIFRTVLTFLFLSMNFITHAEERLLGKCLESLTWNGDYLVEIAPNYGIAYREWEEKEVFLIVKSAQKSDSCATTSAHTIVDSLYISKENNKRFYAVNFSCSNDNNVHYGDAIVGLFEVQSSHAIVAWKIDIQKNRFIKVDNVDCARFD